MQPFFSIAVTETQPDGTAEIISYIPLDVRERSSLSLSSTVSENPVEAGSTITDHVVKAPPRISVSGLVSDTPVGQVSTAVIVNGQRMPGERCIGAYQALYQAWDKSSPLTVSTELDVYEDMQLTSLEFPRDREKVGDALWFDLELQKITIVESLSASLPPDVVAKMKRRRAVSASKQTARQRELAAKTAKEVAAGKVSTETPTTAQSTASTSSAGTYAAGAGR